jgi:hypothetical protein
MRGRVASGKTTVLRPSGPNEDRWPDVAPAARVERALSESSGARKLAAFSGRPDRAGGCGMNALTDGWL